MASHHQLLYHIVFSTKERRALLKVDTLREGVWRYISGIAENIGGNAICVGGYFDHAHMLVRVPSKIEVADFVRQIKAKTTKHINEERNSIIKFHWQDGYGAFTVGHSQIEAVAAYIDRQVTHHHVQSFQEEYLRMLVDNDVEYDPKYLWE